MSCPLPEPALPFAQPPAAEAADANVAEGQALATLRALAGALGRSTARRMFHGSVDATTRDDVPNDIKTNRS